MRLLSPLTALNLGRNRDENTFANITYGIPTMVSLRYELDVSRNFNSNFILTNDNPTQLADGRKFFLKTKNALIF